MNKVDILRTGYETAAQDKFFIAYTIEAYRNKFLLSKETVCSNLQITEEQYYLLGLCKLPEDNKGGLTKDSFNYKATAIAEYIGIDKFKLINLLMS